MAKEWEAEAYQLAKDNETKYIDLFTEKGVEVYVPSQDVVDAYADYVRTNVWPRSHLSTVTSGTTSWLKSTSKSGKGAIDMCVKALRCDPKDIVAVVSQPVKAGTAIDAAGETLTALEDIALGHKIALRDIAAGELVYKYGVPIGRASQAIAKGAWVHTHNLQDITEELCNRYAEEFRKKARAAV